MTVQIKRACIDFVAENYATTFPIVRIVPSSVESAIGQSQDAYALWEREKAFTLRCYLSLQGEDNPAPSSRTPSAHAPATGTEQIAHRYEWAFGITLIKGFYWDWIKELPDESALAIQVVLKSEPLEGGPEAVPIAGILGTLHPSRNTKSLWEQALPLVPKTAAEMAKIGASVLPLLNYVSSGLTLGSNVLASYTDNQKNWFLYQFLDEDQKCPVVEWRINKKVLVEYGPLIRGTLFLAFHNSVKSNPGTLRILLRPQIRYCQEDEICYIVPTKDLSPDNQIAIDISPTAGKELGV
ncbi:MAG TPA: hypothetical protein VKZ53_17085 [Candidatus Angelobacter sp.]|nr:hypothetical protein [Candidatus Angelobacter sp.]